MDHMESLPDLRPSLAYIADYWPRIIRANPDEQGTLIGLPRPYVVPAASGIFQEMYYWDSYFMALGLVATPHEERILDMTENMAYLLRRFGVIPNASRYYFLSRSQPPFFTQMIWLAYDLKQRRGDADCAAWLQEMIALAEQEHETVWLGTAQPHFRQVYAGLSRYFDVNFLHVLACCESGWDHANRCDDRWLDHVLPDLNAILYVREQDFARAADLRGDTERAAAWRARAETRAATMREVFWDEAAGFFFDYDFVNRRHTPQPSLAGFYPLWAGVATPKQAARVVADWLPRFELPGGLVTTLEPHPGYQWAYPNGWAPLQWLVVAGLDRYGYHAEARRIRQKWCANCAAVFAATGAMWEKYNVAQVAGAVEGGLYGSVPGFGWSNAVFVDFARALGVAPS